MRRWLCALTCAAALAPSWAGAQSRADAPPRVAILPVVVHSAASDPSYLSDGLADMLAARLEQLGGMRVVREDDAGAATTRLAQALEHATALQADYVVFGSFTQFGDGASLDLQCAPVRGRDPAAARTLFVQSGAIGDIIPKLDDLADKIAYVVLGDARGKAAVAERGRDAAPIRDLLTRIDALERIVYGKSAAPALEEPAAEPETGAESEAEGAGAPARSSEAPSAATAGP
jgi:TolB-like protein